MLVSWGVQNSPFPTDFAIALPVTTMTYGNVLLSNMAFTQQAIQLHLSRLPFGLVLPAR